MKNISAFVIALLLGFSSCVPTTQVSYDPSYGGTPPVTVVAAVNPTPYYARPWSGWYYQNPTLVRPYLGNVYHQPRPVRVTVPVVIRPRGGRRGR